MFNYICVPYSEFIELFLPRSGPVGRGAGFTLSNHSGSNHFGTFFLKILFGFWMGEKGLGIFVHLLQQSLSTIKKLHQYDHQQ